LAHEEEVLTDWRDLEQMRPIHCENGLCGICDDCVKDAPVCHPLTAEQRVAVLERALAESETSRRRYEETLAWQAKQLDEALARAERAEENWKRCQEEAENLGRALAMQGVA
jgi:hypothetical protein